MDESGKLKYDEVPGQPFVPEVSVVLV